MSVERSAPWTGPSQSTVLPSIYDTFLCKEFSNKFHLTDIGLLDLHDARLGALQASAGYFSKQDRHRAVERLQLETAHVYMQNEEWSNAIKVLRPLWQSLSWRQAGWWHLLAEVDLALRECARMVGDGETLVAVEWELLSDSFMRKLDSQVEFARCLETLNLQKRPKVVIHTEKINSCLSASFAFGALESRIGEPLTSQLIITFRARSQTTPIAITDIRLSFVGGLGSILIQNEPQRRRDHSWEDESIHLHRVALQQASSDGNISISPSSGESRSLSTLTGLCDLTFAPGMTKCLLFDVVPRDAGQLEIVNITINIVTQDFDLELLITDANHLHQDQNWVKQKLGLSQKQQGIRAGDTSVKILPRPPKIRIEISDLCDSYFTNEAVSISVAIINDEESDVQVTFELRLLSHSDATSKINLLSSNVDLVEKDHSQRDGESHVDRQELDSINLGLLEPSQMKKHQIAFHAGPEPAEYVLEVKVRYYLVCDPDTPILKKFETDIAFLRPFEPEFDLAAMVYPSPWPSFFHVDTINLDHDRETRNGEVAGGLKQLWRLTVKLTSSSNQVLLIKDVRLSLSECSEQAQCMISEAPSPAKEVYKLEPNAARAFIFNLTVQRYSLEDSRAVLLNLRLEMEWCRNNSHQLSAVTVFPIPEIMIAFGEPRVLAQVQNVPGRAGVMYLDYTLENPSMYALTFHLTMESSEEFAFSGPKATSVQLIPLSRHTIRFNILPMAKTTWIRPYLRVVDQQFNQTLRVQATGQIQSDSKGILIWVDPDN